MMQKMTSWLNFSILMDLSGAICLILPCLEEVSLKMVQLHVVVAILTVILPIHATHLVSGDGQNLLPYQTEQATIYVNKIDHFTTTTFQNMCLGLDQMARYN